MAASPPLVDTDDNPGVVIVINLVDYVITHVQLVCNHSLSMKTSSAMMDTAWIFRTSIVVDHYHQPGPVPYRRYAGTLTYGRALMGRASRENISCRGLRWDIFPLRSDYGSTSMAWVGLLKWAIYMWHSLLQV